MHPTTGVVERVEREVVGFQGSNLGFQIIF